MTNWPAPFDPAAAERLIERVQALGPIAPKDQPVLHCLGGNSPFLADLALREHAIVQQLLADGPDLVFDRCMAALRHMPPTAPKPEVAAALRQAKRQVALITAIADIGGTWSLENVTAALSDLAETALRLAINHLLRTAHDEGAIRLPDPGHPPDHSGFVILAMGKLGASELNYSSDIDLILLYDAHSQVFTTGKAADAIGSFTSRLARDLVALIETRDANGYVFRCDLRLRPDPACWGH
jgi:glutamate-ammonia-ligase adenylyltransferase